MRTSGPWISYGIFASRSLGYSIVRLRLENAGLRRVEQGCSEVWAFWVALVVKSLPASAGDVRGTSSVPGSGRSSGNPLQSSYLENPMDTGAWWAVLHRVAKSQTGLK